MNKNEILIDSEMKTKLVKFVEIAGGYVQAAKIMGLGQQNLEQIASGKKCKIGETIWAKKINPLVNINKDELIEFLINKYEKAKNAADNSRQTAVITEEYYREKFNKSSSDMAKKIVKNPIMVYSYRAEHDYNSLNELPIDVKELMTNQNFDKFKLIIAMDHFAQCYELFRPHTITQYHHYWGTVKTMDEIFYTLSSFLGIKPMHQFTNYGIGPIWSMKVRLYNEIDWQELHDDIVYVKNSVIKTINENAFKSFMELGVAVPFIVMHYAKNFIKEKIPELDYDKIELISSRNIRIDGQNIEIDNYYDFDCYLQEIKK